MAVVSVVNMKGGVAKTTIAVNLCYALASRYDKRVLLVDLDPQFNATQCVLSGESYVERRGNGEKTVFSIFDDSPPPDVCMTEHAKVKEAIPFVEIHPWVTDKGFDIVPGDLELFRLDMGAGHGREYRLKRYLEFIEATEKYDFVIIDTPPTPSAWMMSALLASDSFMVPVKPEPLSRTGIDLLLGVINRCSSNYSHKLKCLGVVLTIVEEATIVFRDAVAFLDSSSVWKGKRFGGFLPKRTEIAREQGAQRMILELDDPDAKTHLLRIADDFLRRA